MVGAFSYFQEGAEMGVSSAGDSTYDHFVDCWPTVFCEQVCELLFGVLSTN